MGSLWQRRKNPLKAVGLVAGLALRLEREVGGDVEQLATAVDSVEGGAIAVLVPMRGLQPATLALNTGLQASFEHGRSWYRFATVVAGHSDDGRLVYLQPPEAVAPFERRKTFRLPVSLAPAALFRLVVEPSHAGEAAPELRATVTDISEGGCCLSSRQGLRKGEWLGMLLDLPEAGTLMARLRVVEAVPPGPGQLNHHLHCMFVDLPRQERERIARFVARRQRELVRSGT